MNVIESGERAEQRAAARRELADRRPDEGADG